MLASRQLSQTEGTRGSPPLEDTGLRVSSVVSCWESHMRPAVNFAAVQSIVHVVNNI